ncbi:MULTISPECIES: L-rhamnose isomerase [unclassified Paenibacillus]|uniref:L-rhamnose isomerase n=1 Tax=unclassified Paenibacillus TaxID=185978 RepID=UPI00089A81FF|nr:MULTISPECIES: L-rhamnose isomerase [unclassified Paenibacillus]OMC70834.1 L-rhamnose isomerase [Paenibacillus sp. FSL H7-0326]SDW09862.1 L-rhamnose isomerase / sugar isomerase [Paenibacillus sp. PDC88]
MTDKAYALFEEQQTARGIDVEAVKRKIKQFKIETPSWGYGDSGTRFKVFQKEGVPRDPFEKMEDAAIVHRLTGLAPTVAIHIPWDKVGDYGKLRSHAESLGLQIGAVNPNLFQEDDYMLGSVTNTDAAVRRKATDHLLECVDIAKETGSRDLSLWFADGTNYPGQGDIRQRKNWMQEALSEMYKALTKDMRMLIEYKCFEPGFYHTDLADWGMAYNMALKLGDQAQVLVDTGHHLPGANIEHIVAYLIDEKRLGGFHFNSRKYADDDLIVGTVNPYELFLIFYQILNGAADSDEGIRQGVDSIAYMLDQSHNIEQKIPAMIRSVLNVQSAYAKALLIDHREVAAAQEKNDVLAAEHAIRKASEFDVTPLLHAVREEEGLPIDPMEAYLTSSYPEEIKARGKGGASW